MKRYVCSICGFIYNEAEGIPKDSIAPGTLWADLPSDWVCPLCGASKADFFEKKEVVQPTTPQSASQPEFAGEQRDLIAAELSALLSNLAKGCDKQYRPEEASLFNQLADYYKSQEGPVEPRKFSDLNALIQQDLDVSIPSANVVAAGHKDRGALRALTWAEKVTRMQNSLLRKFEQEQESALENTNVYVCEICGFIYVGDEAPSICPVCKVPSMKIAQVERR